MLTSAKTCIDLFSQAENQLKFYCSVFHISLAEERMMECIVSVLRCYWLTLSAFNSLTFFRADLIQSKANNNNKYPFFRADLIQSEANWKLSSTSDWIVSARKNLN